MKNGDVIQELSCGTDCPKHSVAVWEGMMSVFIYQKCYSFLYHKLQYRGCKSFPNGRGKSSLQSSHKQVDISLSVGTTSDTTAFVLYVLITRPASGWHKCNHFHIQRLWSVDISVTAPPITYSTYHPHTNPQRKSHRSQGRWKVLWRKSFTHFWPCVYKNSWKSRSCKRAGCWLSAVHQRGPFVNNHLKPHFGHFESTCEESAAPPPPASCFWKATKCRKRDKTLYTAVLYAQCLVVSFHLLTQKHKAKREHITPKQLFVCFVKQQKEPLLGYMSVFSFLFWCWYMRGHHKTLNVFHVFKNERSLCFWRIVWVHTLLHCFQ